MADSAQSAFDRPARYAVLVLCWPSLAYWPASTGKEALMILGLGLIFAPLMGIPQIKLSAFDLAAAAKIGLFAMALAAAGTVLNIVVYTLTAPDPAALAAAPGTPGALAPEDVRIYSAPRTVPMIFGLLMFCLSVGWKLAAHTLLETMRNRAQPRMPVAIYGAGAAGQQLISALSQSGPPFGGQIPSATVLARISARWLALS